MGVITLQCTQMLNNNTVTPETYVMIYITFTSIKKSKYRKKERERESERERPKERKKEILNISTSKKNGLKSKKKCNDQ